MGHNDRVIIFDTTLRDGEQSPGASMTGEEKLRIAKALERLKVDVIEAGFAVASPGDFAAVKAIADAIKDSTVCSLSRAVDADIERAAQALAGASSGRIHTFIATSPIHMQYKLRMQPEAVVEQAVRAVKKARNLCGDVEFSCEDAGRSEIDFLCRIIEAAIEAGARTINIPDTVGYAVPHEYGALLGELLARIPNADKAVFSVHCHNDLGLAVANSLAAVVAGARQVECTINGLGERAGNAALEEIVMALRTRQDLLGLHTRIETEQILSTSRLVSGITGFAVQPNKAIVGANAFAHESGIHQDGVLKHRETYEIMSAQSVGWHTNRLSLGKLSGRNAFRTRLEELGISLADEAELNAAFARFKALADKKHEVFDEDLQALVSDTLGNDAPEHFNLISLEVTSKTGSLPRVQLMLGVAGQVRRAIAQGSGPVDAAFKAIESIAASSATLQLYSVNAITAGTDSQGEVTVRLEKGGRIVNGNGADTDIIVASVKAYLNALNLMQANAKAHPQAAAV
ncbi:2-isopropylmalate synthase [Stutzerimonas nosocomialis]|uniref:2-isopropylmalate synthase n=2 Tax=Stutzerimonas nosocomialis TaxID=1056496 RepID=UPI001109C13C|nr:2-isopropylmalate synthase [Stutzerimonas nosocomialis]TLX54726.1 2-isopropylmalate synthase [Stutzerimonas nosocomialis]